MKRVISQLSNRITKVYIICLVIIASITIGSKVLIYYTLNKVSTHNELVKVAREQVVICQHITKTSLIILSEPDSLVRQKLIEQLQKDIHTWRRGHSTLQQSTNARSFHSDSKKVSELFTVVTPYFNRIAQQADTIVGLALKDTKAIYKSVKIISDNEPNFLLGMETIGSHYDEELKENTVWLLKVDSFLTFIICLVLFIEIYFVIRPTKKYIIDTFNKLMQASQTANDLNNEREKMIEAQYETQEQLVGALEKSRQAEIELLSKQKFISAITQAMPDIVYVFDRLEFKNIFSNKSVPLILGYTPEDIQQMGEELLTELLHPDDMAEMIQHYKQMSTGKDEEVFHLEYRMRHKQGYYVWFSTREVIFARDESGVSIQVLGVAQDVTEKKKAIDALAESEAKYRSLIENAEDMIYETNFQGFFTYTNSASERIMGYSQEELSQMQYWQLIKEDFREEVVQFYRKQLEDRKISSYKEFPALTKDGKLIWIGQNVMFDYEGAYVKAIRAIARDITKIKLAEETTLRTKEMFEASPDFIAMANNNGVTYINGSGKLMLGYAADENITNRAISTFHPDWAGKLISEKAIPTAIKEGVWVGEAALLHKDGREMPVSQLIISHKNKDGSIKYLSTIARDISKIKLAAQEINNLKNLLISILDTSISGINALKSIRDEQGKLIDFEWLMVNKAAEQMISKKADDLIGKSLLNTMPGNKKEGLFDRYVQVVETGEAQSFEHYYANEGLQTWFHTIAAKMEDGFVVTFTDITNRKKAEMALEKQKEFYETILNHVPSDIAVFDTSHRYLFVNPQAIRDEGVRKWIIGKDDFDYCRFRGHALSVAEQRRQMFNKSVYEKRVIELEDNIYTRDGELRHHLRRFNPVFNNSGELQFVIGYGIDITLRKRIEQELIDQKEMIRKVIDTSPNLIAIKDWDGKFILANKALADIYNATVDNLIGKTEADFNLSREEFIKNLEKDRTIMSMEAFNQPVNTHVLGKAIVHPGTGMQKWFQSIKVPFIQSNADVHILEVSNDITEIKKAEEALISAREQAVQSMKAKEMFLSTMSHEIRTPLNAVIGMTHLLIQEEPRADQLENLRVLKFSAENLLVLINDILDFNKIEAGKITFEKVDFSLEHLLNDIKQTLTYKAEEKNIKIELKLDPNLPEMIIGDPIRFSQIMTNLIGNAVKFTEKGCVQICARIASKTKKSITINFEVSDTGIGIPADKINYIFESFSQANSDTTRKFGGTGLGLAITKRLLELQQSTICVESILGKGSTFSFSLKFKISHKKHEQTIQPYISTNHRNLTHVELLLVEDNQANQLVATKFLNKWGITPDYAGNGKIALDMVQRKLYNVILMDMQMPEMDGYQATRAIRSLPGDYYKNVPIIALTASVMLDVKDKIFVVGMNDYVSKPFNPNELYTKIAKYTLSAEVINEDIEILPVIPQKKNKKQLINYQGVWDLSSDDVLFRIELAEIYLQSFEQLKVDYPLALLSKDIDRMKSITHKIKATVHTLQINTLIELFKAHELLVANTSISHILLQQAAQTISEQLDQVIVELKQIIEAEKQGSFFFKTS